MRLASVIHLLSGPTRYVLARPSKPPTSLEYVVGRGPDVSLVLHDVSVSKRHAVFKVSEDGTVTVCDLGSQHGTRVNDQLIVGSVTLNEGDIVSLGATNLEIITEESFHPDSPTEMVPPCIFDTLSAREKEVFGLIASGEGRQAIAEGLGVSVKTIETYKARIGKKLDIQTRAQYVQLALQLGVLKV